jgi:hypothetical protein
MEEQIVIIAARNGLLGYRVSAYYHEEEVLCKTSLGKVKARQQIMQVASECVSLHGEMNISVTDRLEGDNPRSYLIPLAR